VHGWKGLVVADASVIPTNLGVNPQHTIMGLATVFASEMAGG
jgi:choline dehydrogenase-like flavoprotein